MTDFLDRFIAAFSVIGLIVLLALAFAGVPSADAGAEPECVQPVPSKKIVTL
jgi:hypothetical protein